MKLHLPPKVFNYSIKTITLGTV